MNAKADVVTQLDSVRLFNGLPAAALKRLAASCQILHPPDGTRLFALGDPPDAVYALLACEGRVRVGAPDARGKRLLIEVLQAGDILGEIGVLTDQPRSADADIEGRVALLRLARSEFLAAVESEPLLGARLARELASRLGWTLVMLQDATFGSLEARLARQLLHLAGRGSRKTPDGLRLAGRYRQADLADLMGATTRSIITILNQWRADGRILFDAEHGFITLHDVESLRAVTQADE